MSKRTHLRNAALAAFTVAALFALVAWQIPASAAPPQAPEQPPAGTAEQFAPQFAAVPALSSADRDRSGVPGATVDYVVVLRNGGDAVGTFDITIQTSCGNAIPGCQEFLSQTQAVLNANAQTNVTISIVLPSNAAVGVVARTTVRATLQGSTPPVIADILLETSVIAATPTVTSTSAPATATVTRGPVCGDKFEGDNNPRSAKRIDVATSQEHVICPTGDEDWLVFGGIAGKVYTIDITRMDPGIDLSLELFDANLNSIAYNDDFYNRDPNNPNPGDIRPRITIRIPAEGLYYIRVRDNASRGGTNYFYVIALIDESYGPTPTLVREICLDLFEPDGLPEQARLITSNELQEERRLCPAGDADWVIFFGKSGKRYVLFTDTRRYRGRNEVNGQTQAGADTVMVLTDRDGVSMIDVNDDIPGGNTFDSQIEFIPEVDGFYFIQIKNVGDIGNQFIRYDLTLLLCLPEQTSCGRGGEAPSPGTPPANPITSTPVGTPIQEFVLDPTRTPTPTPIPAAQAPPGNPPVASAPDPAQATSANFADVAFQQLWLRADWPVAAGRAQRSWLWGPARLTALQEPFAEASDGSRLVQYFDKARMELSAPAAALVTNGLLARELASGQIQVGAEQFEPRAPAAIVVAGDPGDPDAPTYASFSGLIAEPFPDRTGADARDTLDRAGRIGAYAGLVRAEARLVRYIPETSHNIPAVFWQLLTQEGEIYAEGGYRSGPLFDWVATVGYPLSEPYWVRVQVAGRPRDVLVQLYERRALTYTPDNPAGWQVEMGNVGRHYYQWRYDAELP